MTVDGKLGIGVVGLGYWGPNLVRNFTQNPECRVVAAADLDAGRRNHVAGLYPDVDVTDDAASLFADDRIDAVCIATPVFTHHPLAKAALDGGKHVWVEKPLAGNVGEAEDLAQVARERDRVLMVDHTFLYSAPVRKLKELVAGGELGDLLYLHSVRVNLGLFQPDINVVWDLAAHDIAIMNYLIGCAPEGVNVSGDWHVQEGIEDVAFVSLHYPGRIVAHLHLSWLDPCKIRRVTVVGDRKMVVYDDLDGTEPIRIYNKGVSRAEPQPYYDDYSQFKLQYRHGDMVAPHLKPEEPLRVAARHFVDCIRGREEPVSGADAGVDVVRVLAAAQESIENAGRRTAIR